MIYNYAIIGAGLTGALISYQLTLQSIPHIIIDKGRGVGGRFSSRRNENTYFNHGSQVIPFNDYEKEEWFQQWIQKSWIRKRKFHWSIEVKASDLIKSLIAVDTTLFREEILAVKKETDYIELSTQNRKTFSVKKIIVTAPAPQAAALVGEWIEPQIREKMLNMPFLRKIIFFVANKKLLRFSTTNDFTIESKSNDHMFVFSDEISAQYFDKADAEIILELMRPLQSYVDDLVESDIQIKRWRYAQPIESLTENFYQCDEKRIFLSGDGFAAEKLFPVEKVFHSVYSLLIDSDLLS